MRRLLVLSGLAAVPANIVVIGYLVTAGDGDRSWPVLASAVATAATLVVIATLVLPGRPRPASPPAPPVPLPVPVPGAGPPPGRMAAAEPLENRPWVKLVEECVALLDEIDRLRPSLDASCQDFADHLGCRLQEVLERSGVTVISGDPAFDRSRHQTPSTAFPASPGAPIAETLRPGFAVGRRVFRRARVRLSDVASTEKGARP